MPRGNRDNLNLTPSTEEAREKGKKGGIASGASRRRKKELRERLETILSAKPELSDKDMAQLKRLGMDTLEITNDDVLAAALFGLALSGKQWSLSAIEYIHGVVGENPLLQLKEREVAAKERDADRATIDYAKIAEATQAMANLFNPNVPERNIQDFED